MGEVNGDREWVMDGGENNSLGVTMVGSGFGMVLGGGGEKTLHPCFRGMLLWSNPSKRDENILILFFHDIAQIISHSITHKFQFVTSVQMKQCLNSNNLIHWKTLALNEAVEF